MLAVLDPERVMVADPRTGAAEERALPGGTLCHGPVLALGARVVYAGVRDGRPAAVSRPLSIRGPARSLGRADSIAATPGRLWLGRWARDRSRLALREHDAAGPTGRRITTRLARWTWIAGIVDAAILVRGERGLRLRRDAPNPQKGARHLLEGSPNPAKGARHLLEGLDGNPQKGARHLLEGSDVRIRGAWPLATGERAFAWCRGQASCRRAGVWRRGGAQALAPPPGVRVRLDGSGAFSPDGRRLALPVTARGEGRVAVVELGTGRWQLGGRLSGYRAVAWSPSGRWVYATVGRRITAWAPGGAPPRPLPIETGGTVMSIATTR